MDKLLTKKKVLTFSFIFTTVFLLSILAVLNHYCGDYSRECKSAFGVTTGILFPFPIIFIFSLLTYFMREEVFTTWIKFAKWWVLASILLVLVMPSSDGSFLPVDKGSVAVFMSVLFTILSLVIVATKFFSHKSEAK